MAAQKQQTPEQEQIERTAGRRALEQICAEYAQAAWVRTHRSFSDYVADRYRIGPVPEGIDQYDMALEIGRELLRTRRYLDWLPK